MSKRSRKVAERMQRNAEQPDIEQPMRHPTSAYVKRLMAKHHERFVLPLAADVRVSGQLLAALAKLVLSKGIVTEQELSDALKEANVVAAGETEEPGELGIERAGTTEPA